MSCRKLLGSRASCSFSSSALSYAGRGNTFALDMLGIWDAEQYSRLFHALSVASEPDDTFLGEIDSGYSLEPFHNHPSMEPDPIVARHDRRAYPLGSSAGRPKSL